MGYRHRMHAHRRPVLLGAVLCAGIGCTEGAGGNAGGGLMGTIGFSEQRLDPWRLTVFGGVIVMQAAGTPQVRFRTRKQYQYYLSLNSFREEWGRRKRA